jgi:anti-sigma factor ChrR (cupin superfamily)
MSGHNPEISKDVHELASLYALDALDASEKAAFEQHLQQGCSTCERELRHFAAIADSIGKSVPTAPPSQARERLRARLGTSPRVPGVLFQQGGLLISRSRELTWQPLAPGIAYKPLYEDSGRKYNTSLVKMEPGAHYPGHRHAEIEELFLLSGDLHIEGQTMRTGDYCRADSGTLHGKTFTDAGCLFLLLASQQNEVLSEHAF